MLFIRMKVDRMLFPLLLWTLVRIRANGNGHVRESRQTLYPPPLVYPFGGTLKLVVGLAVPVQLSGRILVYGQNIQFQYPLPDNATFFTNFFEDSSGKRRKRAAWNERAPLYDILRQELDRRGIDGKGCLLKNICEAAGSSLKNEGLIGEFLHLLFTPDDGDFSTMGKEYLDAAVIGRRYEDCSTIYSTCPAGSGALDKISTVY